MTEKLSILRELHQNAGLSLRELVLQIGETHSNIVYWERTGKLPRSDVLMPIAKALRVSVEELLRETKTKRFFNPGGR